eukprot:TRINITY_DN3468_c0_g1_i2.p1 TRINITY_DN3468_c0_g1~~TRINITY_DN3468_c0_g1_i2.p1  ORF type:complete len:340 (-),score=86.87 TRINITY_DN3468_c0_g1_i2:27-902(-)
MSQQTVNIGEIFSIAIGAAEKAGDIIRTVWKSGKLDIKEKGHDDPFTIADIQSQQLIMGLLNKRFPSLPIVGEEDCAPVIPSEEPDMNRVDLSKIPAEYQNVNMSDVCVFIDPLDATKEYTTGNLEAVMSLIGIAYKGNAIAGVMYQPFIGNGRMIWGMNGYGYSGFENKDRKDGRIVMATTKTHSSPQVEEGIRTINPNEVMRVGGAGYKALLVLEGKADIYLFASPGTKKWDTCAPEAIIKQLGGKMTDIHGNPFQYFRDVEMMNQNGVLCSINDHQKYVNIMTNKSKQ